MRSLFKIGVLLAALFAGGFAKKTDKPKPQVADVPRVEVSVNYEAKSGRSFPRGSGSVTMSRITPTRPTAKNC